MKLEFFWQVLEKLSNVKFSENPSRESRTAPYTWKDWRTDMTKLTVAFRNFANAPKKVNAHTMKACSGNIIKMCDRQW
jgi:hypothetical protein